MLAIEKTLEISYITILPLVAIIINSLIILDYKATAAFINIIKSLFIYKDNITISLIFNIKLIIKNYFAYLYISYIDL